MVLITVGEFVSYAQPKVYQVLCKKYKWHLKGTQIPLVAAYVSRVDKYYERVMQERPMPGRGGLLPGEGEGVL